MALDLLRTVVSAEVRGALVVGKRAAREHRERDENRAVELTADTAMAMMGIDRRCGYGVAHPAAKASTG